MSAAAGTDVELRLSAVTENFKTEMRESARELGAWGKGVGEVSRSVSDFTNISGSIGEVFEGVAKGNYADVFKGIGSSVKELALGVPGMAAGFKTALGIMEGIAPLAIQIAGVALPVAAVATAVYMGVEAWKSYREAEESVVNMGKELETMLKPVASELEATKKRVQELTNELAVLGESPASQKLIKANAQYAQASQSYFGNMALYEEQIGRVAAAEGEELSMELKSLKFLEDKIKLEREQMAASRAEIDLIERMTSAQKRLEAAQKWRENVKQFGEWGSTGEIPMTVMTNEGAEDLIKEEIDRALAELNSAALARTKAAMARIDNAARKAAEEYIASLEEAQSVWDRMVSGVLDAGKNIGMRLAQAGGEFGRIVLDAMRGFQSGGIFGAIAAVFSDIVSRSKAFARQSSYLSGVIGKVVEAFEPLIEALSPTTEVVGSLVLVMTETLAPVMEMLAKSSEFLGKVVAGVGIVLGYVALGIAKVWNGIMDAFIWIFEKLANIPLIGGAFDALADSFEKMKMNTDKINDSIDQMENAFDGDTSAIDDNADALAKSIDAQEQLLNIPQGYKVELARFNASAADVYHSGAGYYGPKYGGGNAMNIEQVVVVTNDPKEMYRKIEQEATRRSVVSRGTPVRNWGAPYAGATVATK